MRHRLLTLLGLVPSRLRRRGVFLVFLAVVNGVLESVAALLAPSSGSQALETYWLMHVLGKPDDGRAAVRRVVDLGIPLPIRP